MITRVGKLVTFAPPTWQINSILTFPAVPATVIQSKSRSIRQCLVAPPGITELFDVNVMTDPELALDPVEVTKAVEVVVILTDDKKTVLNDPARSEAGEDKTFPLASV